MISMESSEKRKFKRVPYTKTVTINNSLTARCSDISEGGLFVHLTRAVMPGDMVKVAFPDGLTVMAVVQVVSAHGTGLMFTGLKPDQAAGIKAIIGKLATDTAVRKSKPTVLMVEDSDSVRRLARSTLEAQGLAVLEASDGLAALKVLGDEVPDIILLDLHMEKMDGYKLLHYVKQIDKLKALGYVQ